MMVGGQASGRVARTRSYQETRQVGFAPTQAHTRSNRCRTQIHTRTYAHSFTHSLTHHTPPHITTSQIHYHAHAWRGKTIKKKKKTQAGATCQQGTYLLQLGYLSLGR